MSLLTQLGSLLRRGWHSLAAVMGPYRTSEIPGIFFAGRQSSAGVAVTEDAALSLSAVFAGVNLLARSKSTLPYKVYRLRGRERTAATAHPAYRLLSAVPNPEMTAASLWRTWEWHRILWGNAYCEIAWAGNGTPAALWPIEPWRVRPKREPDGSLYYLIDGTRKVAPGDILHQAHVTMDGICGKGFLDFATESLGLAIGTQQYASAYFGNGARPGAVLKHPGRPDDKAMAEFRRSWNERHAGAVRGHTTAVLYGGWDLAGTDNAFDGQRSQLLEQRQFSAEEVSRWLNIPPHLLRDLSRATFSNIEHQGIDFVIYSLMPQLVELEQEVDRKLLNSPNLYSKHSVAALLRGDSAARSNYYRTMLGIGALNINEVRDLEELNPVAGGDVHLVPANMTTLERMLAGDVLPPTSAPTGGDNAAPDA